MSQWGLTLDQTVSLTAKQGEGLLGAYLERKKIESKILISTLGEALKPQQKGLVNLGSLASLGIGVEGL